MKFNFTIVASVVAVALMIGCALVPFTYGQDSPQAVPVNEVTGDGAVLPELPDFGALLPAELNEKLGMESEVIEVNDIYVPIENTISDYNAIRIIDCETIANGEVKALYGNGTAFDGDVTVKSGGTIVLFPYNAKDYTLKYSAGTRILLECDSIVNIFGLSFRYVNDDPLNTSLVFFENKAGGEIKKTTDGDKVTDEIIVNAGGSLDIDSVADVYNSTPDALSAFKFTYQKAGGAGFDLTNGNLTVTSIQTVDGTTDTSVKDLKVSDLSVSFADEMIKIAEKGAEFKFKFERQMSGSEKQTVSDIEITAPEINVDAKIDANCEKSGKIDKYIFDYTFSLDVKASPITVDVKASPIPVLNVEVKGLVITLDGTNTFSMSCEQNWDEDGNKVFKPTVYANLNVTAVIDELTVGGAFKVVNHGIEVKIKADKFNFASDGTSDALAKNISNIDGKASLAATVSATEIEFMAYNLGFDKIVLNFDVSVSYNKTVTPVRLTVDVKDSIELTNLDIDSPDTIGVLKGINFVTTENFRIVIDTTNEEKILTGDASLRFSFAYDGMERPIALNLTGINYKKSVDDQENTITEFKAGKINADCDLPLKALAKLIPSIEMMIPGIDIFASISAEDLNIMKKTSSEDELLEQSVTAKKLSATVGSGILPSIEKLNLELSEFSVEQEPTAFTAKNLTGYLKNYGKEQQNLSGSDVTFGMDGSGFALIKGSYTFNSGFLPLPMHICKDVTFNANGLSALSFDFEKGAVAKGKVSFNTAESLGAISRSVTMGGNNVLTIEGYQAFELPDCGYTVSLDLEALNGTLTAGKGYMLPEYSEEYGPEWTVVDEANATFTVLEGGATYTFACVPLEYEFSYSGGEVVKKAYRDEFSLNALEAGQVAWFDGFKLWYEADLLAYTMPARDVVMTPIYNDTPTPEESGEGEYVSLFVKTDKGSATVDNASIASVGNKGTLTLEVSDVKVVMGKTTLDSLNKEKPGLTLRLTVVKVSEFDDDLLAEAAAGGSMYSIDFTTDTGEEFYYKGMESFLVTVNVPAPNSPSSFDIKYINNDTGGEIIRSVGVVNVNFLGDGTADVTFECNHFSSYAIVPVYDSGNTTNNVLIYVGLLVIAIVAVIIVRELK